MPDAIDIDIIISLDNNLLACCMFSMQGEAKSSTPQLQVIIPSAAFGGMIISFILCPAELVKV